MSLLTPILSAALPRLGKVAVTDDRRQYTYGQLLGGAMFLAERIEQATSAPNVGIILPTSGASPMALIATWFAARTAVPFNYLLNKEELAYVIDNSQVDTIITLKVMFDMMGGAAMFPPHVRFILIDDVDFTGIPPLRWPPLVGADETAVILYTSGTSGRPKGVMLTHGNLRYDVQAAIIHAGITRADGFLGVLPQFHSFGLMALTLIPLFVGSPIIYAARFTPRRLVELIRKHRPHVFMAVPSMYGALLSVKDTSPDDFKSVRLPISGGEALPKSLADEYLARFNLQLFEGYGLTETSPVTHWSSPTRFRPGSVGTQLPGVTTLIVDEQDRILPEPTPGRLGPEGEIIVTGPNVMKGYYRLPEETRSVIITLNLPGPSGSIPTRCFRTGDIGRIDSDGFLYITGRKKEIFKVAGEMVTPREVEEVLNQHPTVKDAAVVPKKDDVRGEIPVAFVEIKDGQTFDETALRAWCRDRLAGFKVPREITKMDALPRNATGKILRRKLTA